MIDRTNKTEGVEWLIKDENPTPLIRAWVAAASTAGAMLPAFVGRALEDVVTPSVAGEAAEYDFSDILAAVGTAVCLLGEEPDVLTYPAPRGLEVAVSVRHIAIMWESDSHSTVLSYQTTSHLLGCTLGWRLEITDTAPCAKHPTYGYRLDRAWGGDPSSSPRIRTAEKVLAAYTD